MGERGRMIERIIWVSIAAIILDKDTRTPHKILICTSLIILQYILSIIVSIYLMKGI